MFEIRKDFPQINDNLVYLDNAATTFKPKCVIDAIVNYYQNDNANIRRGLYDLSVRSTKVFEEARQTIANFIGADSDEIIFTGGTTDGLNMLAKMLDINNEDEIAVCITEHHSNMLPWRNGGAKIRYIYCDENGHFSEKELRKIGQKTKLLAVTAYSNVLGKNHQLEKMIRIAHNNNAIVVVDGAQAVAHQKIDMHKLDIDCCVFSGHKIYGPMGIGVLFVRKELQKKLYPAKYGGEMVTSVTETGYLLADGLERFEAGTQNVEGAVGLATAMEYLQHNNVEELWKYEQKLSTYAFNRLSQIPYLELAGARTLTTSYESSIICFWISDVHSHDVASILNSNHIAIRAGYLCAQPLIERIGKGPVCRISLSFYNTYEEIDKLVEALKTTRRRMGLDG